MSLRLLHITDSHLYHDPTRVLKGVCTHDSFAAIIADAYRRFPAVDAVILGGDMAQDEQAATYRMLDSMLPHWQAPVMITPGNHAALEHLYGELIPALKAHTGYRDHVQGRHWQIIALNSHQAGHVAGRLPETELARLQQLLSASATTHALIALHHHPIPISSRWMDAIGLENRDELWNIIRRHPQVRALLCGHIHQPLDVMHDGVRVLASPSTCVQFIPCSDTFELAALSPGYRWLDLLPDGVISTGIHRITGIFQSGITRWRPDTLYSCASFIFPVGEELQNSRQRLFLVHITTRQGEVGACLV